ncbi:MAG: SPOR domain-containing protein [Bdellovibrionales bacterium]|nr:SPOR domain-containing protein [Ramlibacter sp.]
MKKQFGGTIIGLIIGVVIGLGAALAVAVYVTKVPIPFLNKGQTRAADHDEAEARKNKEWDPNAPLYGKNPAKPTAVAPPPAAVTPDAGLFPAPAAAASAAKPATATAVKTTPGKAASASASADPLGDLAKARSGAAPNRAVGGADPFSYFVQVGAYRTADDAEAQRAKLSLNGVETKITEREQSGRTVFRVRAGPFDRKDDADKIKERLDATGLESALVRVQR